jgi:cystathionine gamma-lyase
MQFQTRAIHVGQEPESVTGAVVVPIFQTSTYAQEAPGVHKGHEYSRTSNPTRDALQQCLASLESARHGLAFASGMAASSTLLLALSAGDHVVSSDDVYGGTFRVFDKVMRRQGLEFTQVDTSNLEALKSAIRPTTKLVWVESPTNPLLTITDIRGVARICKERGLTLVVDNTFMSPALQRPLELGADLVLHSTTKYIGGHSDVVGGFIGTNSPEWHERLKFLQNAVGGVPGPFDAWLTLRGVKTLALRMETHCRNAQSIAEWLSGDARVESVLYPGLAAHPGHAVHAQQASGGGGVISFRVRGGLESARRVCSATKLFFLAESLGGVESLIEHPAIMTHASVPAEQRQARGLGDNLLRISVGIEHLEDLRADLNQALSQA